MQLGIMSSLQSPDVTDPSLINQLLQPTAIANRLTHLGNDSVRDVEGEAPLSPPAV